MTGSLSLTSSLQRLKTYSNDLYVDDEQQHGFDVLADSSDRPSQGRESASSISGNRRVSDRSDVVGSGGRHNPPPTLSTLQRQREEARRKRITGISVTAQTSVADAEYASKAPQATSTLGRVPPSLPTHSGILRSTIPMSPSRKPVSHSEVASRGATLDDSDSDSCSIESLEMEDRPCMTKPSANSVAAAHSTLVQSVKDDVVGGTKDVSASSSGAVRVIHSFDSNSLRDAGGVQQGGVIKKDRTSARDSEESSSRRASGGQRGSAGAEIHDDDSLRRQPSQEGVTPTTPPGSSALIPAGNKQSAAVAPGTMPCHDIEFLSLLSDRKEFVRCPGPFTAAQQCFIVREKGTGGILSKAPHVYKLYCEDTQQFLLAARRRKRTTTASYLVSLDESDLNRDSLAYCGKTKSNFLGTEFWIYDGAERVSSKRNTSMRTPRGLDTPGRSSTRNNHHDEYESGDGESARSELAVVQYQMNVMGTNGPRKMIVAVPYVDPETQATSEWRPKKPADSMMAELKGSHNEIIKLVNKAPKWNQSMGAYCLNFGGRVTQASVKNFQLVAEGDDDRDVLQFGRVGPDQFSMDFRWPVSAFQALCICITSLDSKLACE